MAVSNAIGIIDAYCTAYTSARTVSEHWAEGWVCPFNLCKCMRGGDAVRAVMVVDRVSQLNYRSLSQSQRWLLTEYNIVRWLRSIERPTEMSLSWRCTSTIYICASAGSVFCTTPNKLVIIIIIINNTYYGAPQPVPRSASQHK